MARIGHTAYRIWHTAHLATPPMQILAEVRPQPSMRLMEGRDIDGQRPGANGRQCARFGGGC